MLGFSDSSEPDAVRPRLRRTYGFIGVLVVALGGFLALNYLAVDSARWASEQSAERIQHEHGIVVPASASEFQCEGDAWTWRLDRAASSVFVMARSDLPALQSQLVFNPSHAPFVSGDGLHRDFHVPWPGNASPLATWNCKSTTGDFLHVEVWPVNDELVGVWLYTDWN